VPEFLQFEILLYICSRSWLPSLHGADQQVFISMFGRDELDDVGFVPHDTQGKRAKGVCEYIGQALLEDAIVKDGREWFHRL